MTAYQLACEQECELCAKGVTRTENGGYYHRYGENGGYAGDCTAPSKEAFMKRQAAQIAAMQAALAQGGHADECRKRCCECLPLYLKTGAACAKCDCNCYLSTFSDDVERGKELLWAEDALGNLLAVIHGDGGHYQSKHGSRKSGKDAEVKYINISTQVDELAYTSQRQAVEIEELRKDKERLDWIANAPTEAVPDLWVEAAMLCPIELDEAEKVEKWLRIVLDAAMKEKP